MLLWTVTSFSQEPSFEATSANEAATGEVLETAQDAGPTDAVLQELIQLLEQETELATKSKMNVDFVPGMMSVLHGKDMLARGVENVYQALGLLPGIEISRTNDGQPQILVRGIGKSFFSAKVKFLLNSTPFNATLGAATTLLTLPIEQVERIEVIRGPGSAVYGEYASVGVINIITRKDDTALFGRANDLKKHSYGGMYSQQAPGKDLAFNISVSQVTADGGDVDAGPDILFGTPQESISNAPGRINNKEDHKALLLDISYKDYLFSWQRVEQGIGDYFGLANALPSDQQRIIRVVTMQSFELSRKWQINGDWNLKGTVGLLDFKLESDVNELFPAGFTVPNPAPPPAAFTYPEGVLGGPNYDDDRYYVSADVTFNGAENHEWLLGADLSYIEQGETFVNRNYDPDDLTPITAPPSVVRLEGDENWLKEGLSRTVVGLYAHDQYTVSEKLKFTMGLRFDHYDDVGSDVMPRLAGVYQIADKQTLKFQYARSFRPPTFLELYTQNNLIVEGNPDLESENVDTIEAAYVFNDGSTVFRSTVFYFIVHDLIVIDSTINRYTNQGKIGTAGLELEFQQQITRTLKVDATLTSIHAEDDQTGEDVAGIAKLAGNVALLLQPWPDYVFGLQLKALDDRKREPADSRPDLDGYSVLDVTLNMFNLGLRNLNLRTGIKNLFDNDVIYPAPLVSFPLGTQQLRPAYPDDYPQTGREFFLQVDYAFN
ncbi:MAG: TonB-dependent receptor [Gammaproteobacteria bacterium]|nr:TonB-dependent receptor [Gammaproteobacteria bacterium]